MSDLIVTVSGNPANPSIVWNAGLYSNTAVTAKFSFKRGASVESRRKAKPLTEPVASAACTVQGPTGRGALVAAVMDGRSLMHVWPSMVSETGPADSGVAAAAAAAAAASSSTGGRGRKRHRGPAGESGASLNRSATGIPPLYQCPMPAQMRAVASSPDGVFLFGGASDGRVFAWHASSGRLLAQWSAHYRAVRVLRVSSDGKLLFSGGDDALLQVWQTGQMVCSRGDSDGALQRMEPLFSLSAHALAVTDIWVSRFGHGTGGSGDYRLVSVSLDRSVKMWRLCWPGAPVKDTVLACPLHAVAMDPRERFLFAGGADGLIYHVDLYTGAQRAWNGSSDGNEGGGDRGPGSRGALASLDVSSDGVHLLSCAMDGVCSLWHVATGQLLKSWVAHGGSAVIHGFFVPDHHLIVEPQTAVAESFNIGSAQDRSSVAFLNKFTHDLQRTGSGTTLQHSLPKVLDLLPVSVPKQRSSTADTANDAPPCEGLLHLLPLPAYSYATYY